MPHFVYIVRCGNGALYTGYAVDVAARVAQHNRGKGAHYTRINGPVELVAAWRARGRVAALKLEWQIKRLPRAQKLALVAGERALPPVASVRGLGIRRKSRGRRAGLGRAR